MNKFLKYPSDKRFPLRHPLWGEFFVEFLDAVSDLLFLLLSDLPLVFGWQSGPVGRLFRVKGVSVLLSGRVLARWILAFSERGISLFIVGPFIGR